MRNDRIVALIYCCITLVVAAAAFNYYYSQVVIFGFPPMQAYWMIIALVVASAATVFAKPSPEIASIFILMAGSLLILPTWLSPLAAFVVWISLHRSWIWLTLIAVLLLAVVDRYIEKYGVNSESLLAILQTNLNEGMDFALANLDIKVVAFVMLFIGLAGVLRIAGKNVQFTTRIAIPTFVFVASCNAVAPQMPVLRDAWRQIKHRPQWIQPAIPEQTSRPLEVVLILGESTSRWHMQGYGYPYPTNPEIVAEANNLILFPDAVASYSTTVASVMSLMVRPHLGGGGSESLITRLNATGIATAWYSTQLALGPWDSPVRDIARRAQTVRFFADHSLALPRGIDYRLHLGTGFMADSDMITTLNADLLNGAGKPTFRVAHLTAAHGDYCRTMPHTARDAFKSVSRGVEYFGGAQDRTRDVNCYDSSIRYIDHLIGSVRRTAQELNRPVVVIFAPDHGEDPDGGTAHASAYHSARHIEIPVIVYFNDAARRSLPNKLQAVSVNSKRPFMLPWLHEAILDLYGLSNKFGNDDQQSVFTDHYRPHDRIINLDSGAFDYDKTAVTAMDYLSQTRLNLRAIRLEREHSEQDGYPNAIFAQAANSELALQEAAGLFDGVEMDVLFNESTGKFEVWHPPMRTNLKLERALDILAVRPELGIWLDWKNPTLENYQRATDSLASLKARYKLRNQLYVETTVPSDTLLGPELKQLGILQSINVQPNTELNHACTAGEAETNRCIVGISSFLRQVDAAQANYISFDRRDTATGLAILRSRPGLRALTWDLSIDISRSWALDALKGSKFADVHIVRFPTRFAPAQSSSTILP